MRKTIFLRFHFQNLKIVVVVHFFSNSISSKKNWENFLDLASNNFSLNFNLYAYLFIFSQSTIMQEALIDDLITTKRSLLSFSYSCFGKGNFPFSYSWATNLSSFCILISHIRVIQVVDMTLSFKDMYVFVFPH